MHSHDRTMVASMGFADPDKKEPLHELACQFLAQPHVAAKIAGVGPKVKHPRDGYPQKAEAKHSCSYGHCGALPAPQERTVEVHRRLEFEFASYCFDRSRTEVAINKGEGKYRTTIGFLDVELNFDANYRLTGTSVIAGRCPCCGKEETEWPGGEAPAEWTRSGWTAGIEVKIGKIPVSDAIRQIVLYREYNSDHKWILAAPWSIGVHEKKCLDDRHIAFIRLGAGFERFCAEAKSLPSADVAMEL